MRPKLKGAWMVTMLVYLTGAATTAQLSPRTYVLPASPICIRTLPNNRVLAIGVRHLWELDGANGNIVGDWALSERFTESAICAISDHLVAFCEETPDRMFAVVHDFRKKKAVQRIPLERGWWIECIAASPSGKTVAWIEQFDVWRAPEVRQRAPVTVARVKSFALPDGPLVSTEITLSDPGVQAFSSLSVAADETTSAVGGHVGALTLHILDMKTRKELWSRKKTSVQSLAFTPDGKSLFTCNNVGQVTRWETATGKEMSTWTLLNEDPALPRPLPELARAVRVSPDGTLVSAATLSSRRLVVWDMATGNIQLNLQLPEWPIENACDFAADSRSIWFSGVNEKAVHVVRLSAQE